MYQCALHGAPLLSKHVSLHVFLSLFEQAKTFSSFTTRKQILLSHLAIEMILPKENRMAKPE